jgi:hypothetical protein
LIITLLIGELTDRSVSAIFRDSFIPAAERA